MDKRFNDLKWLAVTMLISKCYCRCRHCKGRGCFPSSPYETKVTYPEAERILLQLYDWKKDNHLAQMRLTFNQMETWDYEGVTERIRLGKLLYNCYGPVVCNGMQFRPYAQLLDYMRCVRAAGVHTAVTTFYGTRDFHDAFAGREGDFDFTVSVAKAAAEAGLTNMHTLFLAHSTLPYLPEMIEYLSALPGKHGFQFRPILSDFEVLTDEAELLSKNEFAALPEFIRRKCPYKMKTRAEWNQYLLSSQFHDETKDYHNLYMILRIGSKDFAPYYQLSLDEFISQAIDKEIAKREATPTMLELLERYGNEHIDSPLLYTLWDIQAEWKLKYHQEHHPGPLFYSAYM